LFRRPATDLPTHVTAGKMHFVFRFARRR
jgi:hypothetical protein